MASQVTVSAERKAPIKGGKPRYFFPLSANPVLLSLFKRSNEKKTGEKGVGVVTSDRGGAPPSFVFHEGQG